MTTAQLSTLEAKIYNNATPGLQDLSSLTSAVNQCKELYQGDKLRDSLEAILEYTTTEFADYKRTQGKYYDGIFCYVDSCIHGNRWELDGTRSKSNA